MEKLTLMNLISHAKLTTLTYLKRLFSLKLFVVEEGLLLCGGTVEAEVNVDWLFERVVEDEEYDVLGALVEADDVYARSLDEGEDVGGDSLYDDRRLRDRDLRERDPLPEEPKLSLVVDLVEPMLSEE